MSNEWPNGHRHAMTQCEHEAWNESHYPGTLELCYECDEPTGNCEEDNLTDGHGNAYCSECFGRLELDQ